MDDEALVQAEIVRCQVAADEPHSGWGLRGGIRAAVLRQLPVDVAAGLLRQEALDALTDGPEVRNRRDQVFEWMIVNKGYDLVATSRTNLTLHMEFVPRMPNDPRGPGD